MSIVKKYYDYVNEMLINKTEIDKYETVLRNIDDYKTVCEFIKEKILELKEESSGLNNIKFKKFELDNNKSYTIVSYNVKVKSIIEDLTTILEESEAKMYMKNIFH